MPTACCKNDTQCMVLTMVYALSRRYAVTLIASVALGFRLVLGLGSPSWCD